MIVLGVLLLVASIVFGADMVYQNTFSVPDVTAFGSSLGLTNGAAFYAIGVITGAAILLGIALLAWGVSRHTARAAARHRHVRDVERHRDELAAENDRLRGDRVGPGAGRPRVADGATEYDAATVYPEEPAAAHETARDGAAR